MVLSPNGTHFLGGGGIQMRNCFLPRIKNRVVSSLSWYGQTTIAVFQMVTFQTNPDPIDKNVKSPPFKHKLNFYFLFFGLCFTR